MRKRRRNGKLTVPTFLLFWLIYITIAMDTGAAGVSSALISLGLTIGAAGIIGYFIGKSYKKKQEQEAAQKAAEQEAERKAAEAARTAKKVRYSPEVDAIIDEGKVAMKEMGRLYRSIENPEIRSRINELMSVSDKIVRDAIDDPSDVPQIRKFLDYYLPTTIKLLNAYDRMSSQEVSGENITGSMQRIEDMLDTTIEAYKKQLDALFANQAADIQMDIEIMNGMLAREGLGGKSYLDLNEFMKQHEKQQQYIEQENLQKGTTSNG